MYRMLTGLILITLGACSTDATRIEERPVHRPTQHAAARAALRIKGMQQLEAAKLEQWQGSITLLQGLEGKPDTLEFGLIAVDDEQDISGGLSFAREITRETGLGIDGVHALNGMGALGQPDAFRIMIKGEEYTATSGKVELEYVAGKLVGTLEAQIEPTRGTSPTAGPIAVTAELEGPLVMNCQVLRDRLTPNDAEGGEFEDPSAEPELVWAEGGLDHSFCRRYL